MSAEFTPLTPEDPTIIERVHQLAIATRTGVGRIAAAGLLVAGGGMGIFVAEAAVHPAVAHAADADTYPWPNAPCEFRTAGGSTCANPNKSGDLYDWFNNPGGSFSGNGCGAKNPSSLCFDNYSYEYRNCTSYVAQKISQEFSDNSKPRNISGWGEAASWATNAKKAGYTLDTSPEEGDIAVWGTEAADGFGHVAYVASVTDGVATFDEYNVHGTGAFTDSYTSANHPGPKVTPDWYIHMGTPAGSSTSTPPITNSDPSSKIAVAQTPSGAMEAFARGVNDDLQTNWQSTAGGLWQPSVESLGGDITGNPVAFVGSNGAIEVFARGANNDVETIWQTSPGGNWSGWLSLGGDIVGDPIVMQGTNGALEWFARGANNDVQT